MERFLGMISVMPTHGLHCALMISSRSLGMTRLKG